MFKVPEQHRMKHMGAWSGTAADGNNGVFMLPSAADRNATLRCIASDGGGWEHVSVSLLDRCPTWDEMCQVKDLFWGEEDCVVQFHPARKDYVNHHPYCLHLWRFTGRGLSQPVPPPFMVGPKS